MEMSYFLKYLEVHLSFSYSSTFWIWGAGNTHGFYLGHVANLKRFVLRC